MPTLGRWILTRHARPSPNGVRPATRSWPSTSTPSNSEDDFRWHCFHRPAPARCRTEWLIIEVTESAAMDGEAQRELDRVRALGVWPSTTSGPASTTVAGLADLPANQLKIDRICRRSGRVP